MKVRDLEKDDVVIFLNGMVDFVDRIDPIVTSSGYKEIVMVVFRTFKITYHLDDELLVARKGRVL